MKVVSIPPQLIHARVDPAKTLGGPSLPDSCFSFSSLSLSTLLNKQSLSTMTRALQSLSVFLLLSSVCLAPQCQLRLLTNMPPSST